MNTRINYPEEVWEMIQRLPYMVAIGMEGAGNSGTAGSASERGQTQKSILEGREAYPGNPLIQQILDFDSDSAKAAVLHRHDEALDILAEKGIESSAVLWDRIEHCLTTALPEMKKREAGHTISDYTSWLLRIAEDVANAAKEGDFLGFGGERFSSEERAYFKRLQKILKDKA